jgi:hypothetical protein
MANTIFTTMVIPGPVKGGMQQFSIGFELNQEHDVFGDPPADPAKWKADVLQFTTLVRLSMNSEVFKLNLPDQNVSLPIVFDTLGQDNDALRLWGTMLGYDYSKLAPAVREKKWKTATGAVGLGRLRGKLRPVQKIQGNPVLGPVAMSLPNTGAIRSSADIFQRINANGYLMSIKGGSLPKSLAKGIDVAYHATIRAEKTRNDNIANYGLQNLELAMPASLTDLMQRQRDSRHADAEKETDNQLQQLLTFYQGAQTVINERDYILEAIDKLNMNLKVRNFLGTMIHGWVTLPQGAITQVSVFVDEKTFETVISAKNIAINYKPYFSGDGITKISGSLPAPIGGPYSNYYTNTVPLLNTRTTMISWETEGAQHNLDMASRSQNENAQVVNANLDSAQYSQMKGALPGDVAGLERFRQLSADRSVLIKAAVKMNNQVSNVQTKGQQVYITDPGWLSYDPNQNRDSFFYEHDLVMGYLVYLCKNGVPYCLNETTEYFGPWLEHPTLETSVLAIGTDAMVHSAVPVDPNAPASTSNINGIHTGFQFLWDGTTVSGRNPLRHQEIRYKDEKDRAVSMISDFVSQKDNMSLETLVLNLYSRRWMTSTLYPFSPDKKEHSEYLLARSFDFDKKVLQPRLKFTTETVYQYAMVGQYHNGYVPVTPVELAAMKPALTDKFNFLRSDHIKSPIVALASNIYEENSNTLKMDNLGETNVDLVIRKGGTPIGGTFECSRYILPPKVPNFQTYLWYDTTQKDDFAQSRQLSESQHLRWYRDSQGLNPDGTPVALKVRNDDNVIYDGSLHYLPDPVVTGFVIKFYYDRDCTLEMGDKYPETFCTYANSTYPDLDVWEVILHEWATGSGVRADQHGKKLHVGIVRGQQIFAEIFAAFDKKFACFFDAYIDGPDFTVGDPNAPYYYDLRKCGAERLSFTYACKKPLFRPTIETISLARYATGTTNNKPSTVNINMKVHFEQLNLWNGITVPGEQPTGEIDVYMLWDDYSTTNDGIQKSIADKMGPGTTDQNYVYVGRVVFGDPANQGTTYHQNLTLRPGAARHSEDADSNVATISFELDPAFNISYFTNAIFKVRNVSKFTSYFQRVAFKDLSNESKEKFSEWSEGMHLTDPMTQPAPIQYASAMQASAAYLFNNQKPAVPKIAKIVPLIVRDQYEQDKIVYYQRVRIYFSQVALTGKDNRIGILVREPASVYPTTLGTSISKAGKDVVTDQLTDPLNLTNDQLSVANFNLDSTLLEEAYRLDFKPAYDNANPAATLFPVGIVSYTVRWDKDQSLHYIDAEIMLGGKDKQEFHNPLVQLFVVSYQPFSANYNSANAPIADTTAGLRNDYRLSAPVNAEFFNIYPSRTFQSPLILFKHHPKGWCTLSGTTSSLFFSQSDNNKLHTDFIVSVQKRVRHGMWEMYDLKTMTVRMKLDGKETGPVKQTGPVPYMSLLGTYEQVLFTAKAFECDFQIHFGECFLGNYRVVIYEVDCFNGLGLSKLVDVLGSTSRPSLLTIAGVRVRNTYVFEDR